MSYAMSRPDTDTLATGGPLVPRRSFFRLSWPSTLARLMTSMPVALAILLVGLAAVIGASVAGTVGERATRLVTSQIVATLSAELSGLEDLDRAAGLAAVATAVDQRAKTERTSATAPQRLYLLVDNAGLRIAGSLAADADTVLGLSAGGLFRYTSAQPEPGSAPRWAVGARSELASGARVIVARDVQDVHDFADSLRWLFTSALAGLTAAGIGIGVLSGRRLQARIESVRTTADQIMAGDLARRIPLTGAGDELDQLALRLNQMLDRIEQLMSGMREISDNIAHDLKTPLSRLRTRAESALRVAGSVDDHREALERTIEAADDIIATFNALLLIARLEAGVVAESLQGFDLSALINDLAELYEPVVEEAQIKLALDVPAGVEVKANRQLIGQAVANLIDNAIKYGRGEGAGGEILIRVRPGGDHVAIEVADRGPGIAPEDRAKVLGRFVRLDRSRSAPGTGLGLSLVAAVARLHGAELRLADNGPGLRVELALPAAPARVATEREFGSVS